MKKTLVIASVLVLSACTARLITPNESDVERGRTMYPGLTLAELNEGKALFEEHCDGCHKLVPPHKESIEEWKKIVPEMGVQAKLTNESSDKILRYVTTMHGAGKKRK